jgi:hypothetical protein
MIQGVTSGGHVGVAAITALRYAQSDGRDVVMPVRPAEIIHANFRHIQVRPDSRLDDGVPLYKLKILDTLIDSLSRDSGSAAAVQGRRLTRPGAGGASIDNIIMQMTSELRQGSARDNSYRARFLPEPGAFVDLLA